MPFPPRLELKKEFYLADYGFTIFKHGPNLAQLEFNFCGLVITMH